jgi:uncharacterized repeat protein (TIGR01451 family)/CSLREA domain-containing protein
MKRLLVILMLAALLLSSASVGSARPAAPPQGGPMRLAGLPAVSHRVASRPIQPAWHAPVRSGPGAVIAVTTTDDELNSDGDCSLREAIQAANTNAAVDACVAGSGDDTVVVPAGTYVLTLVGAGEDGNLTGDLDILDNLVLSGAGAEGTILDGNNADRVLDVQPGRTVGVDGVTVTHGYVVEEDGGGILNQGDLTVNDAVITLNVVDSPQEWHGGAGLSNFPSVQDCSATLNNTLVTYNTGWGGGGLANNPAGTGVTAVMVVSGSSVSHNTALGYAAGINNSWWTDTGSTAILTVTHSLVENNDAAGGVALGGGIYQAGGPSMNHLSVLSVDHCTVRGNTATGGWSYGGGIYSQGGTVTVDASTISGNLASGDGSDWSGRGGGVCLDGGTATISNSTISGNQATGAGLPIPSGLGGGIDHEPVGWYPEVTTLNLINTTVSDNYASTAGGGLENTSYIQYGGVAIAIFKNVLIAGNGAPVGYGENCWNGDLGYGPGVLTSLGNNLEDTDECNLDQPTDLPDTDPLLGPLADNSGPTWTHALPAGSPAIDAGDDLAAPPTDQRGLPRPLGAASDIGAYEALLLAFDKTAAPAGVHEGEVVTFTLTVRNTEPVTATDVTLSDLLPAGLEFLGPVTIEPPGAGQTGTLPLLAYGITLAPSQAVTVTFPARALDGPAVLTNTATLTGTEAVPLSASVGIEVFLFRVYLPVVLRGASR